MTSAASKSYLVTWTLADWSRIMLLITYNKMGEKVGCDMNSKQLKTKKAIFSKPTPKDITWDEVVSLLLALGCTMKEGKGSRVLFVKKNRTLPLHRPHPENTLKTYVVKLLQIFLLQIKDQE